MNDFETTLRSTLDDDIAGDHHAMITDVRRGVRRRRNRRRAIVAGAAAVVLAAGSLGAARFLTDGGPDAADGSAATSPTHVRAIAPGDDGLLVASYEPACECGVLWRRDGEGWERLRTVPDTSLRLTMTPDGVHGLLSSDEPWVDVTHDGGTTWSRLRIEKPGQLFEPDGLQEWVLAGSEGLWIVDVANDPWRVTRVWQGPADGTTVTPFTLPDFELAARARPPISDVNGTLIAIRRVRPDVTTPYLSHDGGVTWQEWHWPCRADQDPHYLDVEGDVSVRCDAGRREALYRSSDLRTWQPLPLQDENYYRLWTLGAGRYLALTPDGPLLTTTEDTTKVDLPFDPDSIDDATVVDGDHYIATSETIYESTDGGRTWQELELDE